MLHQPKSTNPFNPNQLTEAIQIQELNKTLRTRGCNGCELGLQHNFKAPVLYRGNPTSKKMIIGEAPGMHEDREGLPFVGPAGELLDKILASVGWSSNRDFYLGNVIKCRPVGDSEYGKQNLTPTAAHRIACKPYINHEIKTIDPKLVVLLGRSAVNSIAPSLKSFNMNALAGTIHILSDYPGPLFFIMYHPAAILHSTSDPAKYNELRLTTWNNVQYLREIANELGV